ncbi:MAG: glycosyltransferase [Candidatus Hodarchaeales archaeon]|jgi:hypothetical protein
MKHSIISWDSTFRNFFHLIDGLLAQDFDRDEWELIYVEQHSLDYANAYNHSLGLPALSDRCAEAGRQANIYAVYMNDAPEEMYHHGRILNYGIKRATGDIISYMDGDQLLAPNFLEELTHFHDAGIGVAGLLRHILKAPTHRMARIKWMEAPTSFQDCVESLGNKPLKPSRSSRPKNDGPLVSALREFWEMTRGFDTNRIWGTSGSRAGGDIVARLEIATGRRARRLMNTYAIHPWHPIGYGRRDALEKGPGKRIQSGLQQQLVNWCVNIKEYNWMNRVPYTIRIYQENKDLIEEAIKEETRELIEMRAGNMPKGSYQAP